MAEAGSELHLALEALQARGTDPLRSEQLDGGGPAQERMARAIHDPHPSLAHRVRSASIVRSREPGRSPRRQYSHVAAPTTNIAPCRTWAERGHGFSRPSATSACPTA